MQNTRSRSFLGFNFFIFFNRFSIFLWHFLRLLGCKRMVKSHFTGNVLEQGEIKKTQFPKDGVRRVDQLYYQGGENQRR